MPESTNGHRPDNSAAASEMPTPASLVPQVWHACPHCGGLLDLGMQAGDASPQTSAPAPPQRSGRIANLLGRMLDDSFPISSAINQALEQRGRVSSDREPPAADSVPPPVGAEGETGEMPVLLRVLRWYRRLNWRFQLFIAFPILVLALTAASMVWRSAHAVNASAPSAQTTAPPVSGSDAPAENSNTSGEEAAIINTITRYNAAEAQVGSSLSVEPIRPYLDPAGPLLGRRSDMVAQRAQQQLTHTPKLIQWSIGTVSVTGTMAIVTTVETWENQEKAMPAPQQATVRVTYHLRCDADQRRWLITDTEMVRT